MLLHIVDLRRDILDALPDRVEAGVDLGDGPQGPSRFLEARRLTAPPGIAADDFSGDRLRWRVKDQFDFSEFAA